MQLPNEGLIDRARTGDMRAYDDLVTLYRTRAVRIARSFARDDGRAEDIAQEAFVRAYLSIHRLRDSRAFGTYLTRTIVRLAIDHARLAWSHEMVVMDIDPPPEPDPMPPEESLYIRSLLDQLSMKLRTVIVLRDVAGLEYADIARTLRIPIGTVRSRLSAARTAFKSLYLAGSAPEEDPRS